MRRFVSQIQPEAVAELEALANRETTAKRYRQAFYRLGNLLANRLAQENLGKNIFLVCTSEDADFLARGVLDSVAAQHSKRNVQIAFACFWQARFNAIAADAFRNEFDVAPIVKRYEEHSDAPIDTLIVVKSIIASSCVVRHALLDVIGRQQPKRIFIIAPVMLQGAKARLIEEFPTDVASRFNFTYFAEDDQRDELGNVVPGIGGSVYQRLGIAQEGRSFVPELVLERRRLHAVQSSTASDRETHQLSESGRSSRSGATVIGGLPGIIASLEQQRIAINRALTALREIGEAGITEKSDVKLGARKSIVGRSSFKKADRKHLGALVTGR